MCLSSLLPFQTLYFPPPCSNHGVCFSVNIISRLFWAEPKVCPGRRERLGAVCPCPSTLGRSVWLCSTLEGQVPLRRCFPYSFPSPGPFGQRVLEKLRLLGPWYCTILFDFLNTNFNETAPFKNSAQILSLRRDSISFKDSNRYTIFLSFKELILVGKNKPWMTPINVNCNKFSKPHWIQIVSVMVQLIKIALWQLILLLLQICS